MTRNIPQPLDVRKHGVDSSGRDLYFSNVSWSQWQEITDELRADHGITVTVVQGEWMIKNGGGATASAGYHDKRGCWDIRVWDLTSEELRKVIHVSSKYGVQFWVRDAQHGGMDPHAHCVSCTGSTREMASGAVYQVASVARKGDGLIPEGNDYNAGLRAHPLVLKYDYYENERDDLAEEDEMKQEDFERVRSIVKSELAPLKKSIADRFANVAERDAAFRNKLEAIEADVDNAPAEVRQAVRDVVGPRLKEIKEQLAAALPDNQEV